MPTTSSPFTVCHPDGQAASPGKKARSASEDTIQPPAAKA